jgi:NAD(P)-dependent dehydrogenase (short-subunit alcohol dehydrogenase family)
MSELSSFENQGWLVVNGTQGIAPKVILRAAQRNATVVFSAHPNCASEAEQLLKQAQVAGLSERVSFVVTDLADEQAVEALGDAALERLPGLNALIHNLEPKAVLEPRSLAEISLAEWNGVLSSELRIPFMLARRAVEEYLFAQAKGRIVYISYSGSAQGTPPASYATAQTGLRALVRCITKEFGRREVACNAVVAHRNDKSANPNELIETILFLASSESTFVNGEFLEIGQKNAEG